MNFHLIFDVCRLHTRTLTTQTYLSLQNYFTQTYFTFMWVVCLFNDISLRTASCYICHTFHPILLIIIECLCANKYFRLENIQFYELHEIIKSFILTYSKKIPRNYLPLSNRKRLKCTQLYHMLSKIIEEC